jgi:CRISPR type I-D-associated protein Csc1
MKKMTSAGMIIIESEDYIRFTSREEVRTKITYPVLHNIALQYAFKNVRSRGNRLKKMVPSYLEDFKRTPPPYYLFPAIPVSSIRRGKNGAIHCDDEPVSPMTSVLFNCQDNDYRSENIEKAERRSWNMLMYSNVFMINPETVFVTFFLSGKSLDELSFPSIVRIGKKGGKCKVTVIECNVEPGKPGNSYVNWFVNANDIAGNTKPGTDYTVFKIMKMNPCALIKKVKFRDGTRTVVIHVPPGSGNFLKRGGHVTLPICSNFANTSLIK